MSAFLVPGQAAVEAFLYKRLGSDGLVGETLGGGRMDVHIEFTES
jgi:hypothetical protein